VSHKNAPPQEGKWTDEELLRSFLLELKNNMQNIVDLVEQMIESQKNNNNVE